ncbi:MAG: hypothetical protein, partial [Olavius algarvensis Gamma 1 endosymbiont]
PTAPSPLRPAARAYAYRGLPASRFALPWRAALDPQVHDSGSSVHKKPRLSKTGNRSLRIALYMPALSAASHNPHVRGYYRHLIEDRGL